MKTKGKERSGDLRKYVQSTLFAEDSLASHIALPGSEEARTMSVTSGRKCFVSYKNAIQNGSLVKMFLESSIWASMRCYLTWKVRVTKQKRLLFQLVPSMLRTEGIECGLWPTPGAKEPMDWVKVKHHSETLERLSTNGYKFPRGLSLREMIMSMEIRRGKLYSTPSQMTRGTSPEQILEESPQQSGLLNQEFVREMMGYPKGWLD